MADEPPKDNGINLRGDVATQPGAITTTAPPAPAVLLPGHVYLSTRAFWEHQCSRGIVSWDQLVIFLRDCAGMTVDTKQDVLLFNCAAFDGLGIRKENVEQNSAAILDFDNVAPEVFERVLAVARHYTGLAYTSYSHASPTGGAGTRGRIVLALDQPCPAVAWPTVHAGLRRLFQGLDKSCKDVGRGYFVPAINPRATINCGPGGAPGPWFDSWDAVAPDGTRKFLPLAAFLNPANAALLSEGTDAEIDVEIERGELISLSELHSLAQKLTRSKSDYHQSAGRAMRKALSGEPYAIQSARNTMSYCIAGFIAEAFPRGDPESIAILFESCHNLQGEPTTEIFKSQIYRKQIEVERQRRQMGLVSWLKTTTDAAAPGAIPDAAATANAPQPTQAEQARLAEQLASLPYIVQRQGFYWLRDPASPHFGECYANIDAHLAILRKYHQVIATHTDKGPRSFAAILHDYSMPLLEVKHDYLAMHNTLDARTAELSIACMRQDLRPQYHECVNAWLTTLGNNNVNELFLWIRSLFDLTRPAPALYLWGEGNTGKGLLASGLGRIWKHAPAKFKNMKGQFNGDLAHTPLLWADEGLPEDLSFSEFREILTEPTRIINEKYKPTVRCDGHLRIIVCANNDQMFAFQKAGVVTGLDAEAIAARLVTIRTTAEATKHLEGIDTREWPEWIAQHALYIRDHLPLENVHMRWSVAGGNRSSERLALQLGAAKFLPLIQLIAEYLEDPFRYEKMYPTGVARAWAMRVKDGEMLISKEIMTLFDRAHPTDYKRACDLIQLHNYKRRNRHPRDPNTRPYYTVVDPVKIARILDLDEKDFALCLASDTETRLGIPNADSNETGTGAKQNPPQGPQGVSNWPGMN